MAVGNPHHSVHLLHLMILVEAIPSCQNLLVLRMLIPLSFLMAEILFIMVFALLFSFIFIFGFDLENSNLFVTSGLVGFRINHKMVTLS